MCTEIFVSAKAMIALKQRRELKKINLASALALEILVMEFTSVGILAPLFSSSNIGNAMA